MFIFFFGFNETDEAILTPSLRYLFERFEPAL